MKQKIAARLGLACVVIAGIAGTAVADEHFSGALKARKATMQLYSHYLGQLGAMAKGETPYDAAKAQAAADSLMAVNGIDQSAMWPQGSDNGALGDQTRALPEIWTTYPAIVEKGEAMSAAIAVMASAAGTDLASLQGAIGGLGAGCGGCHKPFRQSDN